MCRGPVCRVWHSYHRCHAACLQVPYFTVSGIQIRYLKVIERSGYQALPWVRYITTAGVARFVAWSASQNGGTAGRLISSCSFLLQGTTKLGTKQQDNNYMECSSCGSDVTVTCLLSEPGSSSQSRREQPLQSATGLWCSFGRAGFGYERKQYALTRATLAEIHQASHRGCLSSIHGD